MIRSTGGIEELAEEQAPDPPLQPQPSPLRPEPIPPHEPQQPPPWPPEPPPLPEERETDRQSSGFRLLPGKQTSVIEAWGPDRVTCLTEAISALVASFAEVPDVPAERLVPLVAVPDASADALTLLLEDVIGAAGVLSVVPVRCHLAEADDGGIVGDMEVVPTSDVTLLGPVPRGVSHRDLSMSNSGSGWRCRVALEW